MTTAALYAVYTLAAALAAAAGDVPGTAAGAVVAAYVLLRLVLGRRPAGVALPGQPR